MRDPTILTPDIPVDLESMEAGEDARPIPSLVLPFAVFGVAAGLFALLAIGAFRSAARDVSPLTPALATGAIGAITGVTLRRWRVLHHPATRRDELVVRAALVCLAAGAASGGVIGLATWGIDGFVRFALGGGVVGLLFVPSLLFVFEAARRAARGRYGSLVAETDRRSVTSTVLAGMAFAAATQVPTILNVEVSNDFDPFVQAMLSLTVCLGATIGVVVLQRRDRRARAVLDGFARDAAWLDPVVEDADVPKDKAPPVDLGVGGEQWARGEGGYRSSGRAPVLVKGSIEEAVAVFDECVRRRHHALIIAASSLTAVGVSILLRATFYLP